MYELIDIIVEFYSINELLRIKLDIRIVDKVILSLHCRSYS